MSAVRGGVAAGLPAGDEESGRRFLRLPPVQSRILPGQEAPGRVGDIGAEDCVQGFECRWAACRVCADWGPVVDAV